MHLLKRLLGFHDDFSLLLNNGADKVSINTAAYLNPKLIKESADIYGSQCVVVSIDYSLDLNGNYFVYIEGGKTKTSKSPLDWAIECENNGAGEILLTSIDRDGTGNGIDIELTKKIVNSVSIPVIASGGVGSLEHFYLGHLTKSTGLLAASVFHARKFKIKTVKKYLSSKGVPVRL